MFETPDPTAQAGKVREATPPVVALRELRAVTQRFQTALPRTAAWQLATTFLPLLALLAAMHAGLAMGWWWSLVLALPAAGLVVRVFALQHDCGHGSLFRTPRANDLFGRICSLFTFTPYGHWRRQHAGHHAVWNDLDRRDRGTDIYSTCETVAEYRAMGRGRRRIYRILRHPLCMLLLFPPLVFLALYRLPYDAPLGWGREHRSVHLTNLSLAALYGGLSMLLGVWPVTAGVVAVMVPASIAGVWLFSVQHRFEGVHWARHAAWDRVAASLAGSSYLRLPAVLRWLTASLGFHHVHHLAPRIPNYLLEACHDAHPAFATARVVTLREAFSAPDHLLWDEEAGRMVTFKQAEKALPDDGLHGSGGGPGLLSRGAARAAASLAGRLRRHLAPGDSRTALPDAPAALRQTCAIDGSGAT
ncbi:fatty acid desaturase family protein [Roseicella aquatilis]|uniref:Fatty acid desaturase n=1 Tax=Roseicella aquatilis TaxID=2527868 RepID=A0A4R4DIV1_9PROT|nr:fatty acid desaturase [Roseicella aquatilis]TCZ61111.1 fatty acid desaturase [Roseicella aquatilis]